MARPGRADPDDSIPAILDTNRGEAPFVMTDVPAHNGVIHIIVAVLIP